MFPNARRCSSAMLFCLLLPAFAFARTTVQDDGTFVLDTAGVVDDATEQALEDYLRELEQKTSDQVKLLTVKTTDGEPFFDFAQRHANLWELGQKGKDNAALLVFALDERQFRIHTYYGMEGILPDAWCGTAFRQLARPKFKAGNYAQGLNDVTLAVINKIAAERGIRVTGAPNVQVRQDRTPPTLPAVLFITILIMIIASVFSGTRRGRRYSRGGWVSSYGGSRGGFGGFGGGGGFSGGSFGGGGISGGGGGGGGW